MIVRNIYTSHTYKRTCILSRLKFFSAVIKITRRTYNNNNNYFVLIRVFQAIYPEI